MAEPDKNDEIAEILPTDSQALTTRSASLIRRALVGLSRTRHLALISNISSHAISTLNPDEMLTKIIEQLEAGLTYDHIGIGVLDYSTHEIVVQAEAGNRRGALGQRIPLGTGLVGHVARSGHMAVYRVASPPDSALKPLLGDSVAAIALPVFYAEQLYGIFYIESSQPADFCEEEILLLRTLADLIGGALHNAFSFQRAVEQDITDGLTGVKTHRFFMEAFAAEWKRSKRANRPFSLVALNIEDFVGLSGSLSWKTFNRLFLEIGHAIETICRRSDVVGHKGDAKFLLLFPETPKEEACRMAQVLHKAIKEKVWLAEDSHHPHLTTSVGVAAFPEDGDNPVELFERMDDALRFAKTSTRGGVAAAKLGLLSL